MRLIPVKLKKTVFLLIAVLLAFPVVISGTVRNPKIMIPVPYLSQKGILDSGCELISAVMVLRYYGCSVPVENFAKQVPTSQLIKDGSGLTGEHPSKSFIGDPHSSEGLGCYAPVISHAMNTFLSRTDTFRAVTLTGADFNVLLDQYVAHGTPVILWATNSMEEPSIGPRWTVRGTGRSFQWIGGEHCLVLVGYDRQFCYFNDPSGSNEAVPFDRSLVEKRYQTLGSQAVVVQSSKQVS